MNQKTQDVNKYEIYQKYKYLLEIHISRCFLLKLFYLDDNLKISFLKYLKWKIF